MKVHLRVTSMRLCEWLSIRYTKEGGFISVVHLAWSSTYIMPSSFPLLQGDGGELRSSFRWLLTLFGKREPGVVAAWAVVMFTVVSSAVCSLVQFGGDFLALPYPAVWAVFLFIFLVLALIFCA